MLSRRDCLEIKIHFLNSFELNKSLKLKNTKNYLVCGTNQDNFQTP